MNSTLVYASSISLQSIIHIRLDKHIDVNFMNYNIFLNVFYIFPFNKIVDLSDLSDEEFFQYSLVWENKFNIYFVRECQKLCKQLKYKKISDDSEFYVVY